MYIKLPPLDPGIYPFKVEFEDKSSSKDKNTYGNIIVKPLKTDTSPTSY